jgi:hypothetical protein
MTSEVEQAREGHRDHRRNLVAYHHYVSKFKQRGKTYYVRFTVQEMTGKQGNLAHSAFVSDMTIYEEGVDSSASFRVIDPGLTDESTPLDRKLAQWLANGKGEVSKV